MALVHLTFANAWATAEIGDRVECTINEEFTTDTWSAEKRSEEYRRIKMDYRYANSHNWEIIKAEPKVISDNDYVRKVKLPQHMRTTPFYNVIRETFKAGDLNGQCREWLKLKHASVHFLEMSAPELEEAIENLKPGAE